MLENLLNIFKSSNMTDKYYTKEEIDERFSKIEEIIIDLDNILKE